MAELVPCPHCGDDIDRRAKFCRHCGSDQTTGWLADADQSEGYAGDGFDDDDYASFLASEGLDGGRPRSQTPPWMIIAALLALVAVALLALR